MRKSAKVKKQKYPNEICAECSMLKLRLIPLLEDCNNFFNGNESCPQTEVIEMLIKLRDPKGRNK